MVAGVIMNTSEPDWLISTRNKAWSRYAELPMPRLKYGLTIKIDIDEFSFDQCPAIEASQQTVKAPEGVFVLDFYEALARFPDLIKTKFMQEAVVPQSKFELFHAAHWKKATVIIIKKEQSIGELIELDVVFENSIVENVLVIAEPNSRATIVESVISKGPSPVKLNSRIVEIFVAHGAQVNFLSLQNSDTRTYTLSTKRAVVGEDARVNWFDVHVGSKIVVSETTSILKGQGASTNNYGLFFGNESQKFDVHAKTRHIGRNTSSDMLTKGVLDGEAKAIYRGVLKIEPSAFNASGYQKEEVTLLSSKAEADSIPELRINNNDIKKCTHGASIGQVDAEKLFYVMSRGFSTMDATKKLVEAFFASLLKRANVDTFSEKVNCLIGEKLCVQ